MHMIPPSAFAEFPLDHLGDEFRICDRGDLDRSALRLLPPRSSAEGVYELRTVTENLVVVTRNIFSYRDWQVTDLGLGRLSICVHLEGKRRIRTETLDLTLTQPSLSIFYQPENVPKDMFWSAGTFERSVMVSTAVDQLPHTSWAWPALVDGAQAYLNALGPDQNVCSWHVFPMNQAIKDAAAGIFTPSIGRPARDAYRLAKAMEILCLVADGRFDVGGTGKAKAARPHLSSADRMTMEVRAMIEDAFPDEISIQLMATRLQTSATNLCTTFRETEGMTIGSYVREMRMRRAEAMLRETTLPLKRIAHMVGYGHVSNFCTAFRRWSGQTPGALREPEAPDRPQAGSSTRNAWQARSGSARATP